MNRRTRTARRTARNKALAIAAAGTVLVSGATVASVAAWTDTEWVTGGIAGVPGVATSSFEVEQNVTSADDTGWTNDLASPGGVVDFGAVAAALTPGDRVAGFVRLRTQTGSVAGTLSLVAATNTTGPLAAAMRYGAWLHDDASTCTLDDYAAGAASQLVAAGSALDADGGTTFTLAAGTADAPGEERAVCFLLELPSGSPDSLQGLTADPVWRFDATSD